MTNEDLEDHPIVGTLAQINGAKEWDELKEAHGTPETSTQLDRIFGFADLVGQRIAATPASLISETGLRALATTLAAVLAELTAFRTDAAATHLATAVTSVDQTGLNQLWALPIASTPAGPIELGRLADDYQNKLQGIVSFLSGAQSELSSANDTLAQQLARQSDQITALAVLLAQQKTDAQATNAEVKRDYAKAEQELRDKFQAALDALVDNGADTIKQQTKNVSTICITASRRLRPSTSPNSKASETKQPVSFKSWAISVSPVTIRRSPRPKEGWQTLGAGSHWAYSQ